MAAHSSNLYNELFEIEKQEVKNKKKADKLQQIKLVTELQSKDAKGTRSQGGSTAPTTKFVPKIDVSRPEKRVFDRISGTGRGKEVPKGGHQGWGKTVEISEVEEAKNEVLEEKTGVKAKGETVPEESYPAPEAAGTPEQPQPVAPKPFTPSSAPQTLEQYEARIAAHKIQVEKKKVPKPKVESEVVLTGAVMLTPAKGTEETKKEAPKKEEKKETNKEQKKEPKPQPQMTTAQFFAGLQVTQPRGGFSGRGRGGFGGRGRFPREGGRGEGREFGERRDFGARREFGERRDFGARSEANDRPKGEEKKPEERRPPRRFDAEHKEGEHKEGEAPAENKQFRREEYRPRQDRRPYHPTSQAPAAPKPQAAPVNFAAEAFPSLGKKN